MKSLLVTLVTFVGLGLFSNQASASFIDRCEFEAEVVSTRNIGTLNTSVYKSASGSTYTRVMKIKIISSKSSGGHVSCKSHKDKHYTLVLSKGESYEDGAVLTIDYFYANSMLPDGIAESEKWTVKDEN